MALLTLPGCTDLDETVYSQVSSNNYFNTREDVISMAFRAFEHGYWTIVPRFRMNELSADQLIIPRRDGSWDDGGVWRQFHYHTWTPDISRHVHDEWDSQFAGIGQCNFAIDRFNELTPDQFGFAEEEWNSLKMQNRVLRCWFYLRLLDAFRNVPFCVSYDDQSQNTLSQVPPEQIFNFIEEELKAAIPLLYKKERKPRQRVKIRQHVDPGRRGIIACAPVSQRKGIHRCRPSCRLREGGSGHSRRRLRRI